MTNVMTLGEVATYINGRAFKPSEWEETGLPIIRIQNLTESNKKYNYSSRTFDEKFRIQNDDLLFAWSASLGAFIWKGGDAWLNQHIFKVEPKPFIQKRYLYYFLLYVIADLYTKTHGSGMVHITKGPFMSTPIQVPSRPEQKRIVEKIDELFSGLDAAESELQVAKKRLHAFQQAILKSIFARFDIETQGKYLSEIGEYGRGKSKHRPRNDVKLFENGQYPFIQTGEIRNAHDIITKAPKYYNDFGLAQSKLWPVGTLCITIAANIAETAFLGIDACFPDSVVGFIADPEKINVKFIEYYFRLIKYKLSAFAPATAQKNINLDILDQIKFPYCDITIQNETVDEIERNFQACNKVSEIITIASEQLFSIRQGILKQAFEGGLV